jgi:hypothetical protein
MHVRTVLGDVGEQLRAGLRVTVRLRELHDGAMGLAGQQESFLPVGVGHVDVDGMKAGGAYPFDRGAEVAHFEREVMGPVAVAGEESRKEVVAIDLPRFEQLDRHAVAGVGAEPHLHRPETDRLASEDDASAEVASEKAQGGGRVGGGERDVIEIERQHEDGDVRRR